MALTVPPRHWPRRETQHAPPLRDEVVVLLTISRASSLRVLGGLASSPGVDFSSSFRIRSTVAVIMRARLSFASGPAGRGTGGLPLGDAALDRWPGSAVVSSAATPARGCCSKSTSRARAAPVGSMPWGRRWPGRCWASGCACSSAWQQADWHLWYVIEEPVFDPYRDARRSRRRW